MIDPNTQLAPGQRVTLPHEVVSRAVELLGEMPARVSMDVLQAIRDTAEVAQPQGTDPDPGA